MNKDIFLHSFRPILPQNYLPQKEIIDWIIKGHLRFEKLSGCKEDPVKLEEYLRRFALNDKYISNRYFDCDEVDENWADHEIYKITKESLGGADIKVRNLYFGKKVKRVFEELYLEKNPSHVVHVTCTGYISPSPAQEYFAPFKDGPGITHAYHMGCYASLPAIRSAMGLHLLEEKEIDVVHTEMCSLHLNPTAHTPEQMVVQTLFADGHIKYSVGALEDEGFKVLTILERLIPDSKGDMTWIPSANGMSMTLSREVPIKIRDSLPLFVHDLCEKAGVSQEDILRNGIFAVHPGGPKIIEAVQKKLELREDQVKLSQKVLFERGNMSSATLPHVWDEILKSKPQNGTLVLSLAFGPGLTIFGGIFEVKA
jgi:predicted naringenin-chalcone synthase